MNRERITGKAYKIKEIYGCEIEKAEAELKNPGLSKRLLGYLWPNFDMNRSKLKILEVIKER